MTLKVTPEKLSELGAVVVRTSGEIRASHQVLKGQLLPMIGAEWSGIAATRFAGLYEQFDLHAAGMSDALDGIGRLLERAALNYAEAEQQIASSFG